MEPRQSFDYTMMSTFLICRRRYNYRINRGLVRKKPATPLTFGSAIHKALDVWYTEVDKPVDTDIMPPTLKAFNDEYTEDLELDNKRTKAMGEWILPNYHKQYRDQPWKLIASEMSFELDLPNGKKFCGRIDKIIDWGGVLWVVDHKTTSQLGPQFFKGADPSLQFTGYVWAAKKLGYDVKGIVIDAILVAKGLLPGASKNKNLTPLARDDVYRSQAHLDEWLEIVTDIQEDIDRCEKTEKWCPNFEQCTYYGECPFRNVCKEDADIREKIIDMDFVEEFWSPLKEDD